MIPLKILINIKEGEPTIKTQKIIAIGDSVTHGFPYETEFSWFNLMADSMKMDYINQGENGDTTGGMLSRFARQVLSYKPAYVIIMGGTNDAYAHLEADKVVSNICSMVEQAKQSNIVPIIGIPIPCEDREEENLLRLYRKQLQEYSTTNNILLIDFPKVMANEDGFKIREGLYYDGVHPNKAGYHIMAQFACMSLLEEIAL